MAELIRLWFSKPELGVQFPARDTYFSSFSLFSLGALVTLKAKSIFSFLQKHLRAREYQLKKLSLKYTFLFSLSRNHRQRGTRDQRKMLGPIFLLLKTSVWSLLWRKRSYCKEYRGGWGCRIWTSDGGKDDKDNVNLENVTKICN